MRRQMTGRVFVVFSIAWALAFGGVAAARAVSPADELAKQINDRVERSVSDLRPSPAQPVSVVKFESLAVTGSWKEVWPDAGGKEVSRAVEAKIWNAPIQAALAKHGAVFLPNRDKPYYINDPIVLKSGQRLSADSKTEIRLVPNTSTCMVRNEHPIDGSDRPLPADAKPDTQILIEGGIWTTLATGLTSGGLYQYNGNGLAWSTRQKTGIPPAIHCHGVIFLSNVRGVAVRNLVVRQSGSYALHMSNCREFLVEGVIFGFLNRIRG